MGTTVTALLVLAAAAADDPAGPPLWVTVGLPIGTAIIGAILGRAFDALGNAAERRRAGYSEAVAALVAWAEFPYRVRRRTSDDASTLAELGALGHDLQERLARSQMWIASDSRRVSSVFDSAVAELKETCRDPLRAAWIAPPVQDGASMNLDAFDGPDTAACVKRVQDAARWRFGWRRLNPCRPKT